MPQMKPMIWLMMMSMTLLMIMTMIIMNFFTNMEMNSTKMKKSNQLNENDNKSFLNLWPIN